MKHAMCKDKRKIEKEVKLIRAEVKAKTKTTTSKDDSTWEHQTALGYTLTAFFSYCLILFKPTNCFCSDYTGCF